MYALVNTMESTQDTLGRVISTHRTRSAAEQANVKLQRMTRRANGASSYLPTMIIKTNLKRGEWVRLIEH